MKWLKEANTDAKKNISLQNLKVTERSLKISLKITEKSLKGHWKMNKKINRNRSRHFYFFFLGTGIKQLAKFILQFATAIVSCNAARKTSAINMWVLFVLMQFPPKEVINNKHPRHDKNVDSKHIVGLKTFCHKEATFQTAWRRCRCTYALHCCLYSMRFRKLLLFNSGHISL